MKVKEFFKSKSFKCIIVLLIIVLVAGVFLTFFNALFAVSDDELLQRAINKIYGENKEVEVLDFDEDEYKYSTASILSAYRDEDGNYLVESKGTGGFGGTITCWVLVEVENDAVTGIGKVSIEDSDGETLLSSINHLDRYTTASYTDGFEFTSSDGYMTTGATLSSNAINNAVNGAIRFVNEFCLGISTEDPWVAYKYHDMIDMDETSWVVNDDGTIVYTIVTTGNSPAGSFTFEITVGADKTVGSLEIIVDGSTAGYGAKRWDGSYVGLTEDELLDMIDTATDSDGVLHTGATRSNELFAYACLFAVANYDYIYYGDPWEDLVYLDMIDADETSWVVNDDGTIVYTIVTTGNSPAGSFTFEITVGADKTVGSLEIIVDGSTAGYGAKRWDGSYVGLTEDELLDMIDTATDSDGVLHTGATRSNELFAYACLFAVANYDSLIDYYARFAESESGDFEEEYLPEVNENE